MLITFKFAGAVLISDVKDRADWLVNTEEAFTLDIETSTLYHSRNCGECSKTLLKTDEFYLKTLFVFVFVWTKNFLTSLSTIT